MPGRHREADHEPVRVGEHKILGVPSGDTVLELGRMKVAELRAYAETVGVAVPAKANKKQLLAALTPSDE